MRRHGSRNCQAALRAIVEHSRRNGGKRSGKRILLKSDLRSTDRLIGIDRGHVLILPVDDRLDDRGESANRDRIAADVYRHFFLFLLCASPFTPPPTPSWSLPEILFAADETTDSSSSRFPYTHASFFFCCPSSALAPITWLYTCLSRPRDCSSCRARVSADHSSHSLPRTPASCREEE